MQGRHERGRGSCPPGVEAADLHDLGAYGRSLGSVTSTVSMSSRSIADLRLFEKRQVSGCR